MRTRKLARVCGESVMAPPTGTQERGKSITRKFDGVIREGIEKREVLTQGCMTHTCSASFRAAHAAQRSKRLSCQPLTPLCCVRGSERNLAAATRADGLTDL